MRTGRQEDLVAFITGLLKRQVRSVGTTVKPTTSDFSMSTSARYVYIFTAIIYSLDCAYMTHLLIFELTEKKLFSLIGISCHN